MSSSATPKGGAFGMTNAVRTAGNRLRSGVRRSVQRTPLGPDEVYNAQQVWAMQLGSRQNVPTLIELMQLIERLQIPMQPMLRQVVEAAYADRPKGQFSFSDFTLLLEQCKTLHMRWLHKVRGKHFDDDILEAYIAVGGDADSNGTVDVSLMQQIVDDFHLTLPQLQKAASPASPASPGGFDEHGNPQQQQQQRQPAPAARMLEFDDFVHLLREGDGACFSNQVYLGERDLDEDGNTETTTQQEHSGHFGGSRRGSTFRRGSARHGAATPGPHGNLTDNQHHHARSHTSMEASNRRDDTANNNDTVVPADPATSPKNSRRRAAASPPPKSRFPVLGKPKREKKPKFANW